MTDETTALLVRARGFIEHGWCRGVLARGRSGRKVYPTSRYAVAWCAFGALIRAGVPARPPYGDPACRRLVAVIDDHNIAFFNDRQESAEPVLAAFDRAIAAGSSS